MISRRDAAIRLDIPLEMAAKHGIAKVVTSEELAAIEAEPPAWLVQSRANRTGKPVWVALECVVCGFSETERPKKWWPEWTFLACDDHAWSELPALPPGLRRDPVYGIGSCFIAFVDSAADGASGATADAPVGAEE